MLSPEEKEEMRRDAWSVKRREMFRKGRIQNYQQSFDDYLRFLGQVQNAFTKAEKHLTNPSQNGFKL